MKTAALLCVLAFTSIAAPIAAHAEPFGEQRSESGIRHSFLIAGSKTAIIGEDGEIVWEVPRKSRDGFVLPGGNVLISHSDGNEVCEYTREGEVVFRYKLSAENKEIGSASRLPDGLTLIVERGPKPRLVEVDQSGAVRAEIPLQPDTDNAHMQTRMARKLPGGTYLVPHLLGFAVKEYDSGGDVVATIKTDLDELGGRPAENWPFTAIRLEGGNTLVALTHGNKIVEFDKEGRVAWRADNESCGGRFADPCGAQRLPNGNTVICSYGQRDGAKPKVFEITPDKKVVWEYVNPKLGGVHEIHVLTTNGEPLGAPMK